MTRRSSSARSVPVIGQRAMGCLPTSFFVSAKAVGAARASRAEEGPHALAPVDPVTRARTDALTVPDHTGVPMMTTS
ncbi:hypothetical protein [Caballeronia sp. HLA56]